MRLGIDFDGTLVESHQDYSDLEAPLVFQPGAKAAVDALYRAGHDLILFSARASPRLLFGEDPFAVVLNPGWQPESREVWERMVETHQARFFQMVDFILREFPGKFQAITSDKGMLDLLIDDRALRYGAGPGGHDWADVVELYGESEPAKETA